MDEQWWKVHIEEVRASFRGGIYSVNHLTRKYGVTHLPKPFHGFGNSGAGAIAMAAAGGAARVVMLGYDCQHTGGMRHWHGDHPPGTAGNAAPKTMAGWPAKFRELASALRGVEIINCSRETALDVFPRANLEDVLT